VLSKGSLDTAVCSTLEQVLQTASFSKNKMVWVDGEYLINLPTETMRLLLLLTSKADASGVLLLFYQISPSYHSN
jgi:anti-anti-sigma regulatory factor